MHVITKASSLRVTHHQRACSEDHLLHDIKSSINQSCAHIQASQHHSSWNRDWHNLIIAGESCSAPMQRLAMHAAGVRASASLGPRQVRVALAHRILANFCREAD